MSATEEDKNDLTSPSRQEYQKNYVLCSEKLKYPVSKPIINLIEK